MCFDDALFFKSTMNAINFIYLSFFPFCYNVLLVGFYCILNIKFVTSAHFMYCGGAIGYVLALMSTEQLALLFPFLEVGVTLTYLEPTSAVLLFSL